MDYMGRLSGLSICRCAISVHPRRPAEDLAEVGASGNTEVMERLLKKKPNNNSRRNPPH